VPTETTTPTPSLEAEALPTLPVVAAEYKDKYDGFRYVSNAVAFETLPEARELTYRDTAEAAIVALRAEVERLTHELALAHKAISNSLVLRATLLGDGGTL
jgi:hypothetical protein